MKTLSDPANQQAPTLVRLSLWAAPNYHDKLAEIYGAEIRPLLERHGFVPSDALGRPSVEGVFSRLLPLKTRPRRGSNSNA